MARKKIVKRPAESGRGSSNISMKLPEDLFSRVHQYRYRPDVRKSLKAVVIEALAEYLDNRKA